MTAQGHPRAVFGRAIERGNLLVAETMLRELGRPTLGDLLELTILIAARDPRRHPRVAARWLLRYLEEHDCATIEDAALVAASLTALTGPAAARAAASLRAAVRDLSSASHRRAPSSRRPQA